MTEKFKNRLKLSGILALALLIGGLTVAKASGGFSWANVERYVSEIIAGKVDNPEEGEVLGAVSSVDVASPYLCVNEDCTYHLGGTFIDASTTIMSIANPFLQASSTATGTTGAVVLKTDGSGDGKVEWIGATSTVSLVRLNITGAASSSFKVACGAASTPTEAPIHYIIPTSTLIGTSTLNYVVENNVSSTGAADALMKAKMFLSPARPYLNCKVDATADSVGNNNYPFTQAGNTFDGTYKVRISR